MTESHCVGEGSDTVSFVSGLRLAAELGQAWVRGRAHARFL